MSKKNKTSRAQLDANLRWKKRNKDAQMRVQQRSAVRTYIRNKMDADDAAEFRNLIDIHDPESSADWLTVFKRLFRECSDPAEAEEAMMIIERRLHGHHEKDK